MDIEYRSAEMEDLPAIINFVDFWLTGGGITDKVPGSGHDFFVPKGRHEAYLKKYVVLLATFLGEIVGWAVKTKKGVLIHLLVTGTFRGSGIGSEMLKRMAPEVIRSKTDQSAGDPAGFYNLHGYISDGSPKTGKKKNIEILRRAQDVGDSSEQHQVLAPKLLSEQRQEDSEISEKPLRAIDAMRKKLGL